MTEETKTRTGQDIKVQYTQAALQLGEKVHLKSRMEDEIAALTVRLRSLEDEFKALPVPAAPAQEQSA